MLIYVYIIELATLSKNVYIKKNKLTKIRLKLDSSSLLFDCFILIDLARKYKRFKTNAKTLENKLAKL